MDNAKNVMPHKINIVLNSNLNFALQKKKG